MRRNGRRKDESVRHRTDSSLLRRRNAPAASRGKKRENSPISRRHLTPFSLAWFLGRERRRDGDTPATPSSSAGPPPSPKQRRRRRRGKRSSQHRQRSSRRSRINLHARRHCDRSLGDDLSEFEWKQAVRETRYLTFLLS